MLVKNLIHFIPYYRFVIGEKHWHVIQDVNIVIVRLKISKLLWLVRNTKIFHQKSTIYEKVIIETQRWYAGSWYNYGFINYWQLNIWFWFRHRFDFLEILGMLPAHPFIDLFDFNNDVTCIVDIVNKIKQFP